MEQISTEIDIINVAGLLMNGQDDGLERALQERIHPRSIRTIAPTPLKACKKHPEEAIQRTAFMIREAVAEIRKRFGKPNVYVTGRSYGGFNNVLAAIEMDFKDIEKVIAIEAPLSPDVLVEPPTLLPPLKLCGIYYEHRPGLARRAAYRLQQLGTSRVIMIQGTAQDDVVTNDAQVLPGDFHITELSGNDLSRLREPDGSRGLIIKLPSHLGGISEGLRRTLPQGYRNHLFWSEEKMTLVTGIIQVVSERVASEWLH